MRVNEHLYLPNEAHFRIIREVERLHPECAPLIDYSSIAPGTESIEVLSLQLYKRLRSAQSVEQPVFMAFCQLNAERLTGYIDARLEEGAYPLLDAEIISEVYFRFHRHLRGQGPGSFQDCSFEWGQPGPRRTLYHMLASAAKAIIIEQVDWITASSRPLPGLPTVRVAPSAKLVEETRGLVKSHRTTLDEKDLAQWVAHATLLLREDQRRITHLIDNQHLSLAEVGKRIDLSPIEVARLANEAREAFRDKILTLLADFLGIQEIAVQPAPRVAPIRRLPRGKKHGVDREDEDAEH